MKQFKIFILGLVLILVGFGWYFSRSKGSSDQLAEVGKPAPDFALQDASGRTVRLSDFRGRFVVLNFWATWCAPCVEEVPSLEQLQQRFESESPQKITVLSVSVDSGWAPIKAFSKQKNITYPVLLDSDQDVAHTFGTFKYPETYVIDPSGVVVKKVIGGLDWTTPEVVQYFGSLLRQG